MERYESMTKEELLKELKWLLGQQDMIQEEYRSLQSQCADLAGEHRALEDAYKLKEEENVLKQAKDAHAQNINDLQNDILTKRMQKISSIIPGAEQAEQEEETKGPDVTI